MYYLVWVEIWR